ncbi:TlpA family protein disulfide reductase [Pseudofulvibacter geojedonensis]|uniref:TlpA family protein disulfide reductase n=1 Tax=Pseudofulvibacter geojedonensis TaxID=1123758 RepID=A0ABW3I2F7_9FLAO
MTRLLPILILAITSFFSSCNDNVTQYADAYFGGEIINPKEKNVILYKDEVVIDTIPLDNTNRFYYSFEKLEPGLYSFKHDEFQYVYIEPKDSIFLRVNTIEFDETLTFTGKGALKNNYLIKNFLKNEESKENLHDAFYNKNPLVFNKQVRQEQIRRLDYLDRYGDKYNFSSSFLDVAKANIDYHYYAIKEQYPIYNKKYKDSIDKENYYLFRQHTDLNKNELISFYPYYNYLYAVTDNVSKQYKNTPTKSTNNYLLNYSLNNIHVIDSLIKNPQLKNMVLKRAALNYLTKADNKIEANVFLSTYKKISSCKKSCEDLEKMVQTIERLEKGNTIPSFNVINTKNETINIQKTITQPTVIYFWTTRYPSHLKGVRKKVAQFAPKSNYNFIGLSIDQDKEVWQKVAVKMDSKNEFIFENYKDATDNLLIHQIHKIFVLDANGKILNSELNIFDPKFDEKLSQLQKAELVQQ